MESEKHLFRISPIMVITTSRVAKSFSRLNYSKAMRTWHATFQRLADQLSVQIRSGEDEVIGKFAQVTMGSLNQFLVTPIKSDEEELRRMLMEAFAKYRDQFIPPIMYPSVTTESRIVTEKGGELVPVDYQKQIQMMMKNGNKYLSSRGIKTSPNYYLYESVFCFAGGITLPMFSALTAETTAVTNKELLSLSDNRSAVGSLINDVIFTKGDEMPQPDQIIISIRFEFPANKYEAIYNDVSILVDLITSSLPQSQCIFTRRIDLTPQPLPYCLHIRLNRDRESVHAGLKPIIEMENPNLQEILIAKSAMTINEIIL
jgi:hypothetical protein